MSEHKASDMYLTVGFPPTLRGDKDLMKLREEPLSPDELNEIVNSMLTARQKRDFEINKCYTGVYDRWFKDNCKQYDMPKGTLLIYNCRILHSSMPNNTDKARSALLLNYLNKDIIDEVSKLDNVWSSNGKRP
jgi:hypothetical protein